MVNVRLWICYCSAFFAYLWLVSSPALAQTTDRCPTPVGEIVSAQGSIELKAARDRIRMCLGERIWFAREILFVSARLAGRRFFSMKAVRIYAWINEQRSRYWSPVEAAGS